MCISNTIAYASVYRAAAADWLDEHRGHFKEAILAVYWADVGADSWETYLQRMRTPSVYGDYLSLYALSHCYSRRIVILSSAEGRRNDKPAAPLSLGRSDRFAKHWQPIYLLHLARRALNNCEHYDCLTLLRSAPSDSDD